MRKSHPVLTSRGETARVLPEAGLSHVRSAGAASPTSSCEGRLLTAGISRTCKMIRMVAIGYELVVADHVHAQTNVIITSSISSVLTTCEPPRIPTASEIADRYWAPAGAAGTTRYLNVPLHVQHFRSRFGKSQYHEDNFRHSTKTKHVRTIFLTSLGGARA